MVARSEHAHPWTGLVRTVMDAQQADDQAAPLNPSVALAGNGATASVAALLIAVDNIGDNRNNPLLQLSIFLIARAASQTSRRDQIDQKPALTEQCRESDSCDIPSDSVREGPRRPSRALDALAPAKSLAARWMCCPFRATRCGRRGIEGGRTVVFVLI